MPFLSRSLALTLTAALLIAVSIPSHAATPAPPSEVTGKEFSTVIDWAISTDGPGGSPFSAGARPGATVRWRTDGELANGYYPNALPRGNIDALASKHDPYFHELTRNEATLIFNVDNKRQLLYSNPDGSSGPWAVVPLVSGSNNEGVDAIQLGGPEGGRSSNDQSADAIVYSVFADPYDGGQGASVSIFIPETSFGAIYKATVMNALGLDFGNAALRSAFDVDALMAESTDLGSRTEYQFIFSVAPIDGLFDGGEIWVWDMKGPARFLQQGGHIWNTEFDVRGQFGVAVENVTAIAAIVAPSLDSTPVPEPSTWVYCGAGLALLGFGLSRRRGALATT